MSLPQQLLLGGGFLSACIVLHVFVLSLTVQLLAWVRQFLPHHKGFVNAFVLLKSALIVITISHTLQVFLWASFWLKSDALADWNEAIYFSIVTYTSLGYGDLVLGEDFRVFGAFASVSGDLAFGLSGAFLVSLMTRLLPLKRLK